MIVQALFSSGRAARARLACLLAAVAIVPHAYAASATDACSRPPLKPDAAAWLGEDTQVNGMPVAVASVSYKDSANEVARRYRAYWDDAGVASRALRSRKGWMITALEGECSYVLQLPEQPGMRGMTSGLFSVMRLRQADLPDPVGARAMPLPPGGKVLSDVVSRDPMAMGRTVVLDLDGSARGTHQQYLARLRADGWRLLSDAAAPRLSGRPSPEGYATALQKEGYRLDASFMPNGAATRVVLNLARTL